MSEIAESFASSLSELTINSKPHINLLTMLAEDSLEFAGIITDTVVTHLQKVRSEVKLPVLYLIDSIVKNVGQDYISHFTSQIVNCFAITFKEVDEKIREQLFKLRQTWDTIFPAKTLFALDSKIKTLDPAWPCTNPPSTVPTHLNPKFFKTEMMERTKAPATVESSSQDPVPVRIAPVSSQLINAAVLGRKNRDPRIRQMSSRLESQGRLQSKIIDLGRIFGSSLS